MRLLAAAADDLGADVAVVRRHAGDVMITTDGVTPSPATDAWPSAWCAAFVIDDDQRVRDVLARSTFEEELAVDIAV